MSDSDDLRREIALLRDRTSRLSAASLRIAASLDLDTVLREVVDGARALTGARYGVIATVDAAGAEGDVVTSGLTPEAHRRLVNWAGGRGLFEHFRDLPGAVRLPDGPAYVRSLGYTTELIPGGPLLGTPVRHQGVVVGLFCLVTKEGGGEFTDEDEKILVLFGSQAATAIANARVYRNERRARADLEALIDTSPVGVVVFDAQTAQPVSFNREARRIATRLISDDRPAEQLLRVITVRRADGREFALTDLPLEELLREATTVRTEEIMLSVPDGRSVKTLINATPIRNEDGAVDTVVVTMQDMTPLEALERSRTEFMSLVSHELRAPLVSIKGAAATALGGSLSPDPAELREFFRIIDEEADHMRGLIGDLLDAGRIETGTLSVTPEPVDVARLVDQARNTFLSGGGGNTVLIDLPLDLPRVLADRRRIVQVLNNLFSNAARNAPESSPIRVSALRDGGHVAVSVGDEGRGVSPEQLPHLFRKHARLGGDAGGIDGTGLGLAICKGLVEAHGGRIWAESGGAGAGTRIIFTVLVADQADDSVESGTDESVGWPNRTRILVVDDDPRMLGDVRDTLSAAGYAPLTTGDPREVPHLLESEKPALVLLDLILPGADGIALMEHVPGLADLPVIFISAYGRDETIARALEIGAADYIVKPFSPTELTARIRAVLRRRSQPAPFRLGALGIDYAARRVTLDGNAVELTVIEYELLRVLAWNAGEVVKHETLLRRARDLEDRADSNRVRALVKKLRQKLGDDAARPTYIFTARRVGYRMARPMEP